MIPVAKPLVVFFALLSILPADPTRGQDARDAFVAKVPQDGLPQDDLAGTWTLVSVDNILPDGTRIEPYGPEPEGLLILDPQGYYSVHIVRPGRSSFAARDKAKGTAEEYREAVQGANTHCGHYIVSTTDRVITFRIDHALFPNWEGTEQRRRFERLGDLLRYTVTTTTTGGQEIGEVTWRRARRASDDGGGGGATVPQQ